MNKIERITRKIEANKELLKAINNSYDYREDKMEAFIDDATRYVKAIKERRMICNIVSVSGSGMSRVLHLTSCEKNPRLKEFYYSGYFCFLSAVGYNPDRNHNFRVHGCGMDMVFHTNYSIIRTLGRVGIISKDQVSKLSQMTPNVI